MGMYDTSKKKELIERVAKELAGNIPQELLVAALEDRIEESLNDLLKGGYEKTDLQKLVKDAVEERVNQILRTKYADRVTSLADTMANEALVIAKQQIQIKLRDR
jgi:hypothetical protein